MKFRTAPLILIVLMALTACQSSWNNYVRIYVQNATADSFRVFIAYQPSDTTGPFKIKPNNPVKLLSTYYLTDETSARTDKNTDIWLYNYNDTTWTLLSNYNSDPDYTGRYLKYIHSDNLEVKALNPNLNDRTLTLVITDNLVQEMIRDTLLTDSIFGVR